MPKSRKVSGGNADIGETEAMLVSGMVIFLIGRSTIMAVLVIVIFVMRYIRTTKHTATKGREAKKI